jgi:hypothetical protein
MNTNLKPESLANVEWCWLASGHMRDVTSLKPGDVVLEVTCEGDRGWRLPTAMERAALHDLTRGGKSRAAKEKSGRHRPVRGVQQSKRQGVNT